MTQMDNRFSTLGVIIRRGDERLEQIQPGVSGKYWCPIHGQARTVFVLKLGERYRACYGCFIDSPAITIMDVEWAHKHD